MTKKIVDVRQEYEYLSSCELDGTIDEVISRLLQRKKDNENPDVEVILRWETEYGSWGDRDREQVNIYHRRLETDDEYNTRLEKEESQRQMLLEQKRRQLAQLKKELGED